MISKSGVSSGGWVDTINSGSYDTLPAASIAPKYDPSMTISDNTCLPYQITHVSIESCMVLYFDQGTPQQAPGEVWGGG